MDRLWSCASRHLEPEDEIGSSKANNNWKAKEDNQLSRDSESNNHSNNSSNSNSDNWKTGSGNTTSSGSGGGGGGGGVLRYATSCIRFANSNDINEKPFSTASSSRTAGSTNSSGRRQRFPLPPLALLPCTVRQADPSPPPAEGDVDFGSDAGRSTTVSKTPLPGSVNTAGPTDSSGQWSANEGCRVESITERYIVAGVLGKGTFGRILLAECRLTGRKTALKELPKASTKLADFLREFNYGRQLSSASSATSASGNDPKGITAGHPCIVSTFNEAFETPTTYVFAQEFAPGGDLLTAVAPPNRGGLGETRTKRVARQIGSALSFLHDRRIVHRDVKPENILVYDGPPTSCRRVKLGDFGVARRAGTLVCRLCPGTAYTAPEVVDREPGRTYRVDPATDVWAFGVVLFALLTGNFPWRLARTDAEDRLFADFVQWQQRRKDAIASGSVSAADQALNSKKNRRRSSTGSAASDGAGGNGRRYSSTEGSPSRNHQRNSGVMTSSTDSDDRLRSSTTPGEVLLSDPWDRFAEPFVELIHRLLDIDCERRTPMSVVDQYIRPDFPWLLPVRQKRQSSPTPTSPTTKTFNSTTTAAGLNRHPSSSGAAAETGAAVASAHAHRGPVRKSSSRRRRSGSTGAASVSSPEEQPPKERRSKATGAGGVKSGSGSGNMSDSTKRKRDGTSVRQEVDFDKLHSLNPRFDQLKIDEGATVTDSGRKFAMTSRVERKVSDWLFGSPGGSSDAGDVMMTSTAPYRGATAIVMSPVT